MQMEDVKVTLEKHDQRINNLEGGQKKLFKGQEKIIETQNELEINQAKISVQLQTCIANVTNMSSSINMFVYSLIGVLAGFVLWYIKTK